MKELLQPIFIHGECKYESPSVKEIAAFCKEEKATLWDETKRLFNLIKYMWIFLRNYMIQKLSF